MQGWLVFAEYVQRLNSLFQINKLLVAVEVVHNLLHDPQVSLR